jgi:hypothetical protein
VKTYSDFVDSILLAGDRLGRLRPSESNDPAAVIRIREADDGLITGGKPVSDAAMFGLVRGGLFYLCDELGASHRIAQEVSTDTGAYWHGMIHRREGDFDNARYWFRRAGTLPFFGEAHRAACATSSIVAAQSNWDPYLFTSLCEQERFGANESLGELIKLQRIEFEAVFDYVWRKSF